MKITVVTLVEEQMSPWKGNLPRLPIKSNINNNSGASRLELLSFTSALRTLRTSLDQTLGAIDGMQLRLSCLTSRSIISTGSSTKLSLSSSQISFIGMTRDLSHKHFLEMWKVASCGWSFASAVPGQMTHLVASLTLDSANSCKMHGASCTQRKISMVVFSIPFVLSWGGSISSDSFLPSILLLVVIVVTVVIVVVILVVVVAIVGVVVVVVVGSGVTSIIKLSFVIVGSFSCYWSSSCPSVPISIVSIFHGSSLCFQSCDDTDVTTDSDGILSHS
ncbi:hypothetical protein Tco_0425756 [Tanacetum coccineum]